VSMPMRTRRAFMGRNLSGEITGREAPGASSRHYST
jgi:hypothetical protein